MRARTILFASALLAGPGPTVALAAGRAECATQVAERNRYRRAVEAQLPRLRFEWRFQRHGAKKELFDMAWRHAGWHAVELIRATDAR